MKTLRVFLLALLCVPLFSFSQGYPNKPIRWVVPYTGGGITEALRIAALASAWKLPIHPHSSMTGLNHAASIHFLAAIDNGGYFEGDVSKSNRFRDELVENPGTVDRDGNVWPLDKPGLGLEVNEEFLSKHPAIEGPGYV